MDLWVYASAHWFMHPFIRYSIHFIFVQRAINSFLGRMISFMDVWVNLFLASSVDFSSSCIHCLIHWCIHFLIGLWICKWACSLNYGFVRWLMDLFISKGFVHWFMYWWDYSFTNQSIHPCKYNSLFIYMFIHSLSISYSLNPLKIHYASIYNITIYSFICFQNC